MAKAKHGKTDPGLTTEYWAERIHAISHAVMEDLEDALESLQKVGPPLDDLIVEQAGAPPLSLEGNLMREALRFQGRLLGLMIATNDFIEDVHNAKLWGLSGVTFDPLEQEEDDDHPPTVRLDG